MEEASPVLDVEDGWIQEAVELLVEVGVLPGGVGVSEGVQTRGMEARSKQTGQGPKEPLPSGLSTLPWGGPVGSPKPPSPGQSRGLVWVREGQTRRAGEWRGLHIPRLTLTGYAYESG